VVHTQFHKSGERSEEVMYLEGKRIQLGRRNRGGGVGGVRGGGGGGGLQLDAEFQRKSRNEGLEN